MSERMMIFANGAWHPAVPGKHGGYAIVNDMPEPEPPPVRRTDIKLYGPIRRADEPGDDGFRAASIVAQIQASPAGSEIHLHINSQGGDFEATRQIIDALAGRPEKKIAHIEGIAWSGAFLIAMTCDTREAEAGARMMMHAPHVSGCINSTTQITEWCVDFLNSRLPQIPRTTIRAWLTRNNNQGDGVWFDAKEALRLGIATSVWIDGKARPEIPPALKPFKPHGFSECQCPECKARRAKTAGRQPIPIPPLPASLSLLGGVMLVSKRQNPVCGPSSEMSAEGIRIARKMLADYQRQSFERAMAKRKAAR
jgi:ATP-dependent protease ClpP protease subunit